MAKRSRKRRPRAAVPRRPAPATAKPPAPRKPIEAERPPAPWGSFPLVEIVVAVALVMLVAGFFVGGTQGATLLGTGLVLGSLAGLELSIREHFGGYRSHTLLLAGAVGVVALIALYYLADLEPTPSLAGGIAVGAVAAFLLMRTFRARSGRAFKLK